MHVYLYTSLELIKKTKYIINIYKLRKNIEKNNIDEKDKVDLTSEP
jgi:hypothetical protein